jgi:hypothetical protein
VIGRSGSGEGRGARVGRLHQCLGKRLKLGVGVRSECGARGGATSGCSKLRDRQSSALVRPAAIVYCTRSLNWSEPPSAAPTGEISVRLFVSMPASTDATPLLKGLPDHRCPAPHWGYVIKGQVRVIYADHQEVLRDRRSLPPAIRPHCCRRRALRRHRVQPVGGARTGSRRYQAQRCPGADGISLKLIVNDVA